MSSKNHSAVRTARYMISLASLTFGVAPISRRRQCSGCRWFPSFLRVSLPCVGNEDSRLRCISRFHALSCNSSCPKEKVYAVRGTALSLAEEDDDHNEEFQVVTAISSNYNDIVIVDTPRSRMLLLDSSRTLSLDAIHLHTRRHYHRTMCIRKLLLQLLKIISHLFSLVYFFIPCFICSYSAYSAKPSDFTRNCFHIRQSSDSKVNIIY